MKININKLLQKAINQHKANNFQEAEKLYKQILENEPNHPDANHNMGVLATQFSKHNIAVQFFQKALSQRPNDENFKKNLRNALSHLQKKEQPSQNEIQHLVNLYMEGEYTEALALSQKMTRDFPNFGFGFKILGSLLKKLGRIQDALIAMEKSVELTPNDAEAYFNLGNTLKELGKLSEAEACYRKAVEIKPDYVDAYFHLGNTQYEIGKILESGISYRKTIELKPEYVIAYSNLGSVLKQLGKLSEAEACYRKAVEIKPDYAEAYSNLGVTLQELGKVTEAETSCRKAIELKPDYAEAYYNLGNTLQELGKLTEAETSFCKAIELNPDFIYAYNNLLLGLNYNSELDTAYYIQWATKFGEMVSKKVDQKFTDHNMILKGAKLKVGFVSGDFRNHSVGYFLENFLSHLSGIELVAYHSSHEEDALTNRIKPYFSKWIPIHGKNDKEVADIIYSDNINILIDLSGHTKNNRLAMFAYKPAPLQISWLGYSASTGVAEMDYYVGDNYVARKEEESSFTEKIYRLPNCYLCFSPPYDAPDIDTLPAIKNGFITFGCFNNLNKINNEVIALWSEILINIPSSKLFLKSKQLNDQKVQDTLYQNFEQYGINRDKLILDSYSPTRKELLATYNKIDIALDPFPYTGTTTSVEALYMGVPVLTLKGDKFISNVGESIMHNIKMSDWIAKNKDEYVKKAKDFSFNILHLAEIRAKLRDKSLNSPLFDGQGFANDFQDGLMKMWEMYLSDKAHRQTNF